MEGKRFHHGPNAPSGLPAVVSKEVLEAKDARWVKLHKLKWKDQTGKERLWETAERTTRKGDVDAVDILPLLKSKGNPTKTVIITQFRPPIGGYCIELPAGLVDANESAEQAAIRELKEECGYHGKVVETSSVMFSDPGMSNANMKLVVLEVDLDDGCNANPHPEFDEGEAIETLVVELRELAGKIRELESKGYLVDARLAHMVAALDLMHRGLL
ncbi:hypothetical protein M427DRAFT_37940 [Gonapodya prolifera JEL478]|uniref:Nudix hydrolase domain-containing protein n=1 Tax=Gonapodya prolifera (strain JEL478) TaxID=1344416 RepID=A0A138ZZS9_GONPJ|nr:hypothetical protein M427DRAFT_37940 [Gonapodya prolifera JEL478]|eukprot:KXS10017.1 hypothetical protein M427DRAFT_37940 [Gonapodya prolifera JEL478]